MGPIVDKRKYGVRKLLRAVAAGIALGLLTVPPAGAATALSPQPSVADVAAGLLDAVVNISTAQNVAAERGLPPSGDPRARPFNDFFNDFFERQKKGAEPSPTPRTRRVQSLGSGFVVDPSGIVVTNNHVIEDADEITVNFSDGTKLPATVIGRDNKTDLAVLKVNPSRPIKALRFGDSAKLRVGDWVMAIGNPFGLGGSLTVGILSARNRDINSGPYDDFLQTDAAINRGNSGGPLFNMDGEVVGINTAIISPSGGSIGIGFAVPSEIAVHVIEQLREYGETRRGSLGVRIQPVSPEIADALGMDRARGALITGVNADGPAAAAGVKVGDVVVELNKRPIREMRELPRFVADHQAGSQVELKVIRDGKEVAATVKLALLEEAKAEAKVAAAAPPEKSQLPKAPTFGLTVVALTAELRSKHKVKPEIEGVLVAEVAENSSAADKGISQGEVILQISQAPVLTPEDVAKRIATLKAEKRRMALLLVLGSDGEIRAVPLRLD